MWKKLILIAMSVVLLVPITGCAKKEVPEAEEMFEDHPAFDFGELETLDSDSDGYTDRFVYSFEKEEVAEDLFMQRTVEYEETEAGFMGELTLEFENTGNETKTYSHIEIVPKSFAESVDDLEFSIPPDEVISPDPIVGWEVDVIEDTILKLVTRAKKAAEKVGEEAAVEAAAPGASKTVGTLFEEIGKALDGKKADLDKVAAQARATGKAAVEAGTKSGMEAAIDTVFGSLDDFAFINAVNKCGQQKDSKVKDKCVLQLLARFRDNFKEYIISSGTANFCSDLIINEDYLIPCAVLAEDNISLCDKVKDEKARTNCKWEFITAKCCASCDRATLEECAINKILELGDESLCERFQDKDVREFCLELLGKGKCSEISIEPAQITLEPGEECLFTVKCKDGVFPEDAWYTWDFGDKSKQVQCRDHTYTHSYEKEGQYTIRVSLEEKAEYEAYGNTLAYATAKVTVTKKEDVDITETDLIIIDLHTQAYQEHVEEPARWRWHFGGDFGPDQLKGPLEWLGTSFVLVFTADQGEQVFREEIRGSVTEDDGQLFVSLYAVQEYESKSDGSIQPWANLELKNVPLTPITIGPYPTSFVSDLTGTGVKEYVEAIGAPSIKSAVWTDESNLELSFVKAWEE